MKPRQSPALQQLPMARRAPVAAAALALLQGVAAAQTPPAPNTTSADVPEARSLFQTGGQESIGPRPFTSFLERLSSPVDKIAIKVAGDNLLADGITATDVLVRLVDRDGQRVRGDIDVTIEVDAGARVQMPGRATAETGADRGDIDRIQPGVQYTVKDGVLQFKLIAPYKPESVNLKVSVKSVTEKVVVRYVPDLREMIVVGLIEGHLRSDRFDPNQIVPVRENDGFDNELRNFTKEFNGGSTRLGARAAVYLKGKVSGKYLLTLSYDSEKDTRKRLFQDIDPNAFYPVYGDSSYRGVDAQSSGKLYVRLDKGLSYLLYGDYTTADSNPARLLSQYSRSLPGLQGRYEEGNVTANAFVARQALTQIVDEFPARGVSGPYGVSRSDGVAGSEKIEILVRDRNQTTNIIKATTLTRSLDYEFEPFNGQILFRAPVPSVDDQLNPVSIRVTYEVDSGGPAFTVLGGDVQLKITDKLSVGVAAARDNNPDAPYTIAGANLHLKLSKNTEVIAEVARANSVVGGTTGNFTANNSNNFAGITGPVSGSAARVEIRHSDETLRARAYAATAQDGFNNSSAGLTGGRTELGASAVYQVNPALSLNAELLHSEDRISASKSDAASIGADLKLSDRLTVGAGARHASQNSVTLVPSIGSNCLGVGSGTTQGYNVGYGINQVGNQQIDPATGQPVVCNTVLLPTGPTTNLDTSSLYARATWKATDAIALNGEVQREMGQGSTTLYRLGADWRVAEKTRLYGRFEHSRQFTGAYGLGVGETGSNLAIGIDTQYMQDGSIYSEYRLRDASAGREVQSAVGLRNGWRISEGLRLVTNVERLNTSGGSASAMGLGVEYTASELWKGSSRFEWRQDATNTNYLLTLGVARKLDRNWTLIGRDYLNLVDPKATGPGRRQNQLQVGFAYRPVDNNKFDALGLYERKSERDTAAGLNSTTDIVSLRANYHPTRVWWVSGRYALKRVDELLLGTIQDSYHAQLFGSRVTYDVSNRWSVGALATVLVGKGGARQYAYGVEVGYVVVDNLWVTLGYNFRGFRDDELTGSDYTNRGWVLGMRYKFDEDLFRKNDASVNRTLTPGAPAK
ncbi:MAG: hypothetical protein LCH79_20140 [Proteobacteria bacterium]|nr:hypothetical protein [Pseudomonadota bacterium]